MRFGTRSIRVPEVVKVTPLQLMGALSPSDILLTVSSTKVVGPILQRGQYKMLKRFGFDKKTCKALSKYVHVLLVLDPHMLTAIDAFPPKIREHRIDDHWSGVELLHLRLKPTCTATAEDVTAVAREWLGVSYDITQYVLYPFYMVWGWAPRRLLKWWDDTDKPVCSGLVLRIHQSLGYFDDIGRHIEYPPARLPTMDEYEEVGRYIIDRPKLSVRDVPWYVG